MKDGGKLVLSPVRKITSFPGNRVFGGETASFFQDGRSRRLTQVFLDPYWSLFNSAILVCSDLALIGGRFGCHGAIKKIKIGDFFEQNPLRRWSRPILICLRVQTKLDLCLERALSRLRARVAAEIDLQ